MTGVVVLDLKKAKFTMLVGIAGVGKSTYAKSISTEECVILSSDSIREELYGYRTNESDIKVFKELNRRTIEYLNQGKNVIYDATNINRDLRMRLLQLLPIDVRKECIFISMEIQTCIKRDSQRENSVGKKVILRMSRELQEPTYFEGWDSIKIIEL